MAEKEDASQEVGQQTKGINREWRRFEPQDAVRDSGRERKGSGEVTQ